ncbi:MAG: glucokinase, partial [Alphaproteobacteria bacterium]
MKHILVADIGGTNIRLAMYHHGRLSPVVQLKTALFKRPEEAFDAYISRLSHQPTHMILGVAGPVDNGRVYLTNSGWKITEKKFEQRYHLTRCQLVNDFVLKGYAALSLRKQDYIRLNDNKIQKTAPKCVIGPG